MIKTRADALALLEKPVDDEDLIDRVLEGISDEYKSVIDAINVHDTSIYFVELHEKLLNKEASLQTAQPFPLYQQRKILLPSGIVQIGVHQPPFHNNQALPLRFLLIINANPNTLFGSLSSMRYLRTHCQAMPDVSACH